MSEIRTEHIDDKPIEVKLYITFEVPRHAIMKWEGDNVWVGLTMADAEAFGHRLLTAIEEKKAELIAGS